MSRRAAVQIGTGHNGAQATGQRTVKHGVSRLLPYMPPWCIWLGIMLVAVVGWWLWGSSDNRIVIAFYPLGVFVAHQGAALIVIRMARTMHEVLRWLAVASIEASMILCVLVGVLGPTEVLVSLWGAAGFVLCVYWNIRTMLHHATKDAAQGLTVSHGPVGRLLETLNGAKAGTPQALEGGQVTQELEVVRGAQDVEELKTYVKAVEQVGGMRPGAGRLEPDPDDSGRAKAVWIPKDQLAGMVPWQGPCAFGESIFAPIVVGKYADTLPARVWLTGDDDAGRALTMWLIMGMTGAGKSEGMTVMMADALTRRDFVLWAHDSEKGLQTLAPLLRGGGIDWVTMDVPKGKKMFAAAKRVVKARARAFGAMGLKQWEPGCGFPVLAVWIEEAASLGQLKAFLEIARAARSVGVILILSMQRASHTTLDTDTRAQLGGNVCFGVEGAQDAKFALPDVTLDLGAEPERWRATKPGYAYIAAPGIDEQRSAVELRFAKTNDERVTKAVKDGAAVRCGLHPIDIEAAGADYDNRIESDAYLPGHPDFAKAIGMDLGDLMNMTEADKEASNGNGSNADSDRGTDHGGHVTSGNASGNVRVPTTDETEQGEDESTERDEETEEETAARLSNTEPLPECPDVTVSVKGVATRKLTTAQCQARVQKYLGDKYNSGDDTISVPDFAHLSPPIPRGKEWLRMELRRLCDGDALPTDDYTLTRDDDDAAGVYRIMGDRV